MLHLKYLKLLQRNGRITHRDTGMLISLSGNIVSTSKLDKDSFGRVIDDSYY